MIAHITIAAILAALLTGASAHLTVVLVAVLRGETSVVADWVYHHVAMGIKDFVLVPNECSFTSYNQFLGAVPRFSPADGVNIMLMPRYRCEKSGFQGKAYRTAADFIYETRPDLAIKSTRLAFWDLDEFAVVRADGHDGPRNFVQVLEALAPAEAPSWALLSLAYGTSHRDVRPHRGSVQANFVLRAPLCNDTHASDNAIHRQPNRPAP